jgi:hypothetical protein
MMITPELCCERPLILDVLAHNCPRRSALTRNKGIYLIPSPFAIAKRDEFRSIRPEKRPIFKIALAALPVSDPS